MSGSLAQCTPESLLSHAYMLLQPQPQEQPDEQDIAITAEMSRQLEPLWAALSTTITQIEAALPAHVDTSSEAPSAAATILPPGAAQVSIRNLISGCSHSLISLNLLHRDKRCGQGRQSGCCWCCSMSTSSRLCVLCAAVVKHAT